MSVERDLLGKWHNGDLLPEEYMRLMKETKELLAQPEQPEQEPLSEATINYYLERLGSHLKWDDGFEAGVKWAEKAHGIIGGGE